MLQVIYESFDCDLTQDFFPQNNRRNKDKYLEINPCNLKQNYVTLLLIVCRSKLVMKKEQHFKN